MKGIQNKMEMMNRDLSAEWEAADDRWVKKMLHAKDVEFNAKIMNEKPHIFNEDVCDEFQ